MSDTVEKLGLDALLSPAIHYAEAGVPVAPRMVFDRAFVSNRLQDSARKTYMFNGNNPKVGQIFRAPMQAELLRRVARDGRDAFYTGEVAEDMDAALAQIGGLHTLANFAATKCDATTPISGLYRDVELVEQPPNGQGPSPF